MQFLSLPYWCHERPSGILHEILHLLGYGHEHTRADRDSYVRVVWSNVVSKYRATYQTDTDAHYLLGYSIPYDYDSIMHYAADDLQIDKGRPSLVSTRRAFHVHRNAIPSALDRIKVNRVYNCTGELLRFAQRCIDYLDDCANVNGDECARDAYVRQVCRRTCSLCS